MAMRIVVTQEGCGVPEEPGGSENLPPTVAAVLDADALDPTNVIENGSVAWTDLEGQVPTFNPENLFGEE